MGETLSSYRVDGSTIVAVGKPRLTGGDGTGVMETPLYIAGDGKSKFPSLSTASSEVQSRVEAALPSTVTSCGDI